MPGYFEVFQGAAPIQVCADRGRYYNPATNVGVCNRRWRHGAVVMQVTVLTDLNSTVVQPSILPGT